MERSSLCTLGQTGFFFRGSLASLINCNPLLSQRLESGNSLEPEVALSFFNFLLSFQHKFCVWLGR